MSDEFSRLITHHRSLITVMADIFDQLLTLLHPDRLLRDPRATGAGVRVAILDSGVEQSVLQAKFAERGVAIAPIEGGIFVADQAEPLPYTGRQSAPHGTTVADIILTLAPQVRLFSADIFGPQGGCEVETVIKAIRWAIDSLEVQSYQSVAGSPRRKAPTRPAAECLSQGYRRGVLPGCARVRRRPQRSPADPIVPGGVCPAADFRRQGSVR